MLPLAKSPYLAHDGRPYVRGSFHTPRENFENVEFLLDLGANQTGVEQEKAKGCVFEGIQNISTAGGDQGLIMVSGGSIDVDVEGIRHKLGPLTLAMLPEDVIGTDYLGGLPFYLVTDCKRSVRLIEKSSLEKALRSKEEVESLAKKVNSGSNKSHKSNRNKFGDVVL